MVEVIGWESMFDTGIEGEIDVSIEEEVDMLEKTQRASKRDFQQALIPLVDPRLIKDRLLSLFKLRLSYIDESI